ncbi:hypothetical protein [uncultured Ruminococcus sp.]|uniref:hypothetical protein n=1 Tax=uncultured Ruminococcus sp. TaxID=165186 RepID=UPI0025F3951A|nr:hypothetical protein [uncultured Ruminococcus sp.]
MSKTIPNKVKNIVKEEGKELSLLDELYLERDDLFNKKAKIKAKLSDLNERISMNYLNNGEYRDCISTRKALLIEIAMINDEITFVNSEIEQARLVKKKHKVKSIKKSISKRKKQTQYEHSKSSSYYSKALHGPVYLPSYKRGKTVIK